MPQKTTHYDQTITQHLLAKNCLIFYKLLRLYCLQGFDFFLNDWNVKPSIAYWYPSPGLSITCTCSWICFSELDDFTFNFLNNFLNIYRLINIVLNHYHRCIYRYICKSCKNLIFFSPFFLDQKAFIILFCFALEWQWTS